MLTADRKTARQFLADWFGFAYTRITVTGLQKDPEGNVVGIQFRIHSAARLRYLARRRAAGSEWELILLP